MGRHLYPEGMRRAEAVADVARRIAQGMPETRAVGIVRRERGLPERKDLWRWARACDGLQSSKWAAVLEPRPGLEELWRAIRIWRVFAFPDLRRAVAGRVSVDAIQEYVRRLNRARYLQRRAFRDGQSRGVKWTLLRDSGPLAPVWRGDGFYDPNADEVFRAFDSTGAFGVS